MEHDESTVETQDETTEGQTDAGEETVTEETVESTDTTGTEVKLTYEQKLAAATTPEEKFKIANAEASKNRRLLNKQPKPAQAAAASSTAASQPGVEETVLLANGMPKELLKQLKTVAKVQGHASLLEAQSDPIFVAVKDKFEKDKKHKEASLGVSRGSGAVQQKKSVSSTGLSREEHMRLSKEV